MFKALEIKDARFISFGPATFGFGDIFSIKYTESHTKPAGSAHRGGDVYLLGEVKYSVDSEPMDKQIDETGTKTLMEDLGDVGQANAWQKYIYPKDFFDLPENAVIEEIHVYFVNLDKSIISAEYQVTPTCQ
jgi:hypothetical protein